MTLITTISSITLLINRYNDLLLPFLRQFLLIQNRIKSTDLIANCPTPALISSAGIDQYLVIRALLAFQ